MRDASRTLAPRISVAIPLWGKKTWERLLQQFFQLLAESLVAAFHVRGHDLTLVVKQIDRGDRLHLEQVGAVLSAKVRSDN